MLEISLLLRIAAAVCFLLACLGVPSKVQFVPLGLLLWVLSTFIGAIR